MDENCFEKEELHFAVQNGNLDEVKKLIDKGYNVNAFDDIAFAPLHYAAEGESLDIADCLILAGADVNIRNEEDLGNTPLGHVAQTCSYEMAELLIRAGADPIKPGWMMITALDRASERKKPEGRRIYELLLKTAKDKYGYQETRLVKGKSKKKKHHK